MTFYRDYVNMTDFEYDLRLDELARFCEQQQHLGNATLLKPGQEEYIRRSWEEYTQFLLMTSCTLRKNEMLSELDFRARMHRLLEQSVENFPACNVTASGDAVEAGAILRLCLDLVQIALLSLFSVIWYYQNRKEKLFTPTFSRARGWDSTDC